jgi:hypothetical protein
METDANGNSENPSEGVEYLLPRKRMLHNLTLLSSVSRSRTDIGNHIALLF